MQEQKDGDRGGKDYHFMSGKMNVCRSDCAPTILTKHFQAEQETETIGIALDRAEEKQDWAQIRPTTYQQKMSKGYQAKSIRS